MPETDELRKQAIS